MRRLRACNLITSDLAWRSARPCIKALFPQKPNDNSIDGLDLELESEFRFSSHLCHIEANL